MILESVHLRGAASGNVRIEEYEGRDHLVLPVVALIGEQIIHAVNASHPERISTETLVKAAETFNLKPVVLGHPVRNGKQISANSPDVLTSYGIGTIRNSRMSGPRLLMDVYVDPVKAEKIGGVKFVEDLRASLPCDVSVGAFVTCDETQGELNGRPYKATWRETFGDHLAILWPNGKGACSWSSGCGIRAAMHLVTAEGFEFRTCVIKHEGDKWVLYTSDGKKILGTHDTEEQAKAQERAIEIAKHSKEKNMTTRSLRERFKALLAGFKTATNDDTPDETLLERYLATYEDCDACKGTGEVDGKPCEACKGEGELKAAKGARNSTADLKIIQDMHDRSVSLGAECSTQNVRFMETSNTMTFTRIPAAVREEIEAPLVTAMKKYKDCADCKGTGSKDGNPCEACDGNGKLKVAEEVTDNVVTGNVVIGNVAPTPEELDKILTDKAAAGEAAFKAACRCEEDTSMTPEQKAEIIKTLVADKHSGFVAGDEKMLEAAPDARLESFSVAAEARSKREEELKAASERKLTKEEFMEVAPPELKSLITRQQRQETEVKAQLVATLKAAQSEYSEAELSVLSVEDLSRMARMAKVDAKIDFSGRGVPRAAAAGDEEDFTPPNPYDAQLKALKASQMIN